MYEHLWNIVLFGGHQDHDYHSLHKFCLKELVVSGGANSTQVTREIWGEEVDDSLTEVA